MIKYRETLSGYLFPVVAGCLILIGALLILTGWYLEIRSFVSPFEAGVSRFNTGLMFLLLGLSLISFPGSLFVQRFFLWFAPTLLLTFSLMTFYQYVFSQILGIDELFIRDWMPAEKGQFPGRPSPATSLCFIGLSLAIIVRNIVTKTSSEITYKQLQDVPATRIALVVYASLTMATASTVTITLFVWITGSSDTIFGRLSSGQSLLTSALLLIACVGMIINLVYAKPFQMRFYWLPQSIFVAFVTTGLVIANNTHDNKRQYYQLEISNHQALIKKLAFSAIDDAINNLSSLSWYIGDPMRFPRHAHKEYTQGLVGIVLEKQKSVTETYGEAIETKLPDCNRSPYQLRWVHDRLLISVKAADSNPSRDLCIHGFFDQNFFLKHPWQELGLKFTTRLTPAMPGLGVTSPLSAEKTSVSIAGRDFDITIKPTSATEKMFHQDSRAFIIAIAMCFGMIAAIAVRMLLKSRLHYDEMAEANLRLKTLEQRNRKVLEMAPEAVLLVDDSGTIVYANRRSFEIFGFKPDQLQGESLETLLPEPLREIHKKHRKRYIAEPVTREMGQNLMLEALHANGTAFPVDIVLSPIEYGDSRVVMAIIRDISDKLAEKRRVERDLQEKEVLLKEVYHRVKNNMQVIASLLKMQSRSSQHEQTRSSLQEAALRISALALVHEKLYQSSSLSRASIRSYIESLTETLRQSYLGTTPLKINIEASEGEFEPEVIIPVGLILNELISNAMKHAFSQMDNRDTSIIDIRFEHSEAKGHYTLMVTDNGSGIEDIAALEKSKSLGLKLIRSLTAQLKGKLNIDSGVTGSCFSIEIPENALQPSASPMMTSGIADKYSSSG